MHWEVRLGHDYFGTRYAPCALKPDQLVKDGREDCGFVEQRYVMSETYSCSNYEAKKENTNDQTS